MRAAIVVLFVLVFCVAETDRTRHNGLLHEINVVKRQHTAGLALVGDSFDGVRYRARVARTAIDAKVESCHHRADLLADVIEQISQWIPGRAHAPMTLAESRKR